MSKSILVIDTPNNCASCQMSNINLYDMSKDGTYCQLNVRQNIPWENARNSRPDWCPLKDVPEKMTDENRWYSEDYAMGRNTCIDEILKGANGNE